MKLSKILILFLFSLMAAGLIFLQWQKTEKALADNEIFITPTAVIPNPAPPKKEAPAQIKGIYLTAYSAGNSKKLEKIIDLIKKTELNAAVIDIKDYSGKVLYDSQLELVKKLKLKNNRIGDATALIKKLHDNEIYVIARLTVFQDPELAKYRPEWAFKNKNGKIWRDKLGLAWVDAGNKNIWRYNLALAKEATALGFDEINFDYVRFPSDGRIRDINFKLEGKKKYEIMKDFFQYLNQEMAESNVKTSLDFFGLTMEQRDDMNIGQRLVDAVDEVDYISPMMYPSHYYSGHLGFKNPADHPKEVIANGIKKGLPLFDGKRAKFRPWLQAFNLGAKYDGEKIRAQIDEVEKQPNAGWLLWNAANRYTEAGLKKES